MRIWIGVVASGLLALSACDVVRFPGDGRAAPVIPEGAPGPQPPTAPVHDPYDEGDLNPIPVTTEPEPDTPPVATEPDTNSDSDEPVENPPADVPVANPPETEPEVLPVVFQYFHPAV